jgi:hypothetical protein
MSWITFFLYLSFFSFFKDYEDAIACAAAIKIVIALDNAPLPYLELKWVPRIETSLLFLMRFHKH